MTAPAEDAARVALAALSRPVAHGVNNALMVLFGNLDLLRQELLPGSAAAQRVDRALHSAERLKATLHPYLGLGRAPGESLGDAAALLRGLLPLFEIAADARIVVAIDTAAGLPPARLSRPMLDVALLLVVREAAAALPRGTRLTLCLAAAGDGVALTLDAVPGEAARAALAAAGTLLPREGGVTLLLPGGRLTPAAGK